MKVRFVTGSSMLLTLTMVAAACSGNSSPSGASSEGGSGSSATISLNGQTANDHGTEDVSGGGKQEVEVDSFYFDPTLFTAHVGDQLTLTLSNESTVLHNFSLPDQNIDMDVPAGGEVEVSVTFPDSGTQVFFCKFHQSKGMVGALEVETS